MSSARATPFSSWCRMAHLRPPTPGFPTDRLATGRSGPPPSGPLDRATRLYTSAAVGAPEPVTSEVPTP